MLTNEEIQDQDDDQVEDQEEEEEDTTKVTMLSSLSPEKQDWSFVEPPAVVYDQTLSDSLYASLETMFTYQTPPRATSLYSQSIVHTMNNDNLDHLEPLLELNNETDVESEPESEPKLEPEDHDSFNAVRSGLSTMMDPSCTSVAAQTTTQVFHDFVQLEKTIE
ncbi:unnamed protein product, partial [Rotaria magnacalcarata]